MLSDASWWQPICPHCHNNIPFVSDITHAHLISGEATFDYCGLTTSHPMQDFPMCHFRHTQGKGMS